MVQKRDSMQLDIVGLLLKKEEHIRSIAKKLNESHSTISRKLYELEKENVVDSRKEGKNKIFFLRENLMTKNYMLQAEVHKLTAFIQTNPEIGALFEEILQRTQESPIILFGSFAKGLAKKESDIDIYIQTKDRKVKKTIEDIHTRISVKIGLFDMTSPLIKEIIKDHIIIRGFEEFYTIKEQKGNR